MVDPSKSADQSADEHQAQRAEPSKAKGAALDAMDPEHRGQKGCDSIQASTGPTLQLEGTRLNTPLALSVDKAWLLCD